MVVGVVVVGVAVEHAVDDEKVVVNDAVDSGNDADSVKYVKIKNFLK